MSADNVRKFPSGDSSAQAVWVTVSTREKERKPKDEDITSKEVRQFK